ncbi:hypothetical protein IAQ61_007907 [Plenodomus lingam]|uniref:Predicted protein n=1 Tax=Leptosphaeria maculans (strain JN3 / isolate v23.1.3 / race Av1-4-5-6-7-8) TaxID=985895 RepID=E4ZZP4_LEPMJ|nr:predicted protein [Plenodomus lingam JN3]KAH9867315.1 hypothetical protein IAQ61_007907 [Plenodomus lingam]CBX97160.1 predicted protein [Plenodomus lingam JN3]
MVTYLTTGTEQLVEYLDDEDKDEDENDDNDHPVATTPSLAALLEGTENSARNSIKLSGMPPLPHIPPLSPDPPSSERNPGYSSSLLCSHQSNPKNTSPRP